MRSPSRTGAGRQAARRPGLMEWRRRLGHRLVPAALHPSFSAPVPLPPPASSLSRHRVPPLCLRSPSSPNVYGVAGPALLAVGTIWLPATVHPGACSTARSRPLSGRTRTTTFTVSIPARPSGSGQRRRYDGYKTALDTIKTSSNLSPHPTRPKVSMLPVSWRTPCDQRPKLVLLDQSYDHQYHQYQS